MAGAGFLDRRVRIERPDETQDINGEMIPTWTLLATVWAGKRDVSGREYFTAQAERAEVDTTWRIRWRGDLQNKMRLKHGAVIYDIRGMAEIGRNQWLDLFCVRVQA